MRGTLVLKLVLALSFLFSTTFAHSETLKKKKPRALPQQEWPLPQTKREPIAERPLESVRELTILAYNVLNLKTHVGFFERTELGFKRKSDPSPKSGKQIEGVANAILESNPDIAIFEEVEGVETLAEFARYYLKDQYTTHIVRGNDGRGIEVGLIVKKDLPVAISFESHKDMTWDDPTVNKKRPLFSRDVPTIIVRRANQPTGPPALIVLGNHAKSKRDRPGDRESSTWRTAQYEGIGQIIDQYQGKYGKDVPLILGGDFNTNVDSSEEVEPVRQRLIDTFDIVGLTGDERVTHTFHPNGGKTEYNQIDAIFVSKVLESSVLSAHVYRYKDQYGKELPLPRSYGEREQNPSDHYPVVVTLKTSRIFPEAYGQSVQ